MWLKALVPQCWNWLSATVSLRCTKYTNYRWVSVSDARNIQTIYVCQLALHAIYKLYMCQRCTQYTSYRLTVSCVSLWFCCVFVLWNEWTVMKLTVTAMLKRRPVFQARWLRRLRLSVSCWITKVWVQFSRLFLIQLLMLIVITSVSYSVIGAHSHSYAYAIVRPFFPVAWNGICRYRC